MRWNLQNWIEGVKEKPEPIRRRYVIGCVAVSMFFVLTIWSLTVSENFKSTHNASADKTSNGILPKASNFSLDQILRGETTLDSEREKSSDQFLREQVENRDRPNFEEGGVMPKERGESTTESIESVR